MPKTEKGPSDLVFPLDDSEEVEIAIVRQCLAEVDFSTADQEWLARVIKRSDCLGDDIGAPFNRNNREISDYFNDNLEWIKEELGAPIQTEEDRQTRLALLFGFLLYLSGFNGVAELNIDHKESGQASNFSGWISEFQKHADFSAKRLDFCKLDRLRNRPCLNFGDLIPFLFPEGVPLNQIVHLDMLSPIPPLCRSNRHYYNPKQLEFWLTCRLSGRGVLLRNTQHLRIAKLDTLLPTFSDLPDDILGDKVLGLLHAITEGMWFDSNRLSEQGLNPLNTAWQLVAHELIPFFELLDAKAPEKSYKDSNLLQAWWCLSKVIYDSRMGGLESELSDELRKRLVDSASRHIGILRSELRDSPEDFNKDDSRGIPVFDFYSDAFEILITFAKPWERLRPLLLAFSEMKRPAVASDLRTWPVFEKEPPPDPYGRVAGWIAIGMYPEHLQEELKRDRHLKELREEFAKFCLERLRTNAEAKVKNKASDYNNKDFVEPRSVWRQCYVQALAALRVNPGGRAHRTLFWLLNNDPDEKVKELAKKAHKRVRHLDRGKPNLDEGGSPRRPLFEAFWWLRQAHLITLGIEIDERGAQRTRDRELHRTQEKSDRFN